MDDRGAAARGRVDPAEDAKAGEELVSKVEAALGEPDEELDSVVGDISGGLGSALVPVGRADDALRVLRGRREDESHSSDKQLVAVATALLAGQPTIAQLRAMFDVCLGASAQSALTQVAQRIVVVGGTPEAAAIADRLFED